MIIPQGALLISDQASLLASLRLLSTGVTRYPATEKSVRVRTFLTYCAIVHHDEHYYTIF